MSQKKLYLAAILLDLRSLIGFGQGKPKFDINSVASVKGTQIYHANVESNRENYKFPQRFRDEKFGIFIHWGVHSVPAFGSE